MNIELNKLLVKYIDEYEGTGQLRERLKKMSACSRHEVLSSCKGANGCTSALRSALQNDIETLKCMLVGLNSQQIYQVMKFKDDDGALPLHQAVAKGHTDMIMYILCSLSPEDRFNILKVTGRGGFTPAHWAADKNKPKALQLLLTSVTPEQQSELLAIKTNKGNTVKYLITIPDLSCDYFTVKALQHVRLDVDDLESKFESQTTEQRTATQTIKDVKLKLDAQVGGQRRTEQQLKELKSNLDGQVTELGKSSHRVQELEQFIQTQGTIITQQTAELSRANQRVQDLEQLVQTQGATITQQAAALQRLTERQEEMQRETERALREMDRFNRRCFSTADTGDQEHDEQPHQNIQ